MKLRPDQVEVVLDVTINEARKLALKVKAEQGCSNTATADNSHRFVRTLDFKRIRYMQYICLDKSLISSEETLSFKNLIFFSEKVAIKVHFHKKTFDQRGPSILAPS